MLTTGGALLYHLWRSVGVYGLDLYSMYTSAHEVIHYLDDTDPAAAKLARRRSVSSPPPILLLRPLLEC